MTTPARDWADRVEIAPTTELRVWSRSLSKKKAKKTVNFRVRPGAAFQSPNENGKCVLFARHPSSA